MTTNPDALIMNLTGKQLKAMGLAGGAGMCTGMAVKHIGKQIGVLMGMSFLTLQTLQYFGYIDVHWDKADEDMKRMLGDGSEGSDKTLMNVQSKLHEICTANLPNAGGFSVGLLVGLNM